MASSNNLTVRVSEADLAKLDELAKLQNRPRSQLVQAALKEFICSNNELKQGEFRRIKERQAPAVKAQSKLLEQNSVEDEHHRIRL